MYNKNLEDEFGVDTLNHLKRLLVALVLGNRDESCNIDPAAAEKNAKQLVQAGK